MATSPSKALNQSEPGKAAESYYRPELNVLRFLAFCLVFNFHTGTSYPSSQHQQNLQQILVDIGPFGMQLFFVLSAFLITTLLLKERERTGTVHLKQFYIRRALRIWPLYFGMILGVTVIGRLFDRAYSFNFLVPKPFLYSLLTFWANWFLCLRAGIGGFEILNPLWSISIEEHFYLICPVICKYLSRRMIFVCAAALVIISIASIPFFVSAGFSRQSLWFNELIQFQYFGVGTLLAVWFATTKRSLTASWRVALVIVALLSFLLAAPGFGAGKPPSSPQPLSTTVEYALINIGAAALFSAVLGISSRFVPKSLSYLGKISYGLYVFHVAAIVFARRLHIHLHAIEFGVAFVATIVIASLSFKYYETPFLRLKRKFSFIPISQGSH